MSHNYAGIDSFILDVGYFQITISLDHGITTESIKEIKKVLKMEKFYFVVPSMSSREFKKQRYIGSMTSKGKEMIEQYVLSIPFEPNFRIMAVKDWPGKKSTGISARGRNNRMTKEEKGVEMNEA
jgi:hypothetical protein